ncbi:TetR/AcrR family transcriptional regulator [Kineococcus sp. TBRC 1896]|uniref:TetR/AcrR family transcriptional regulator n=1 Tax=Kineococcus mangrovi TaxID=1660183 RepID=A0ABV4I470_9ACTN
MDSIENETETETETGGRARRARATRDAIADAAERLFAEHGVDNVSHRQISTAAGQGNNAAVGYHFGTTEDLLRAIVQRHARDVDVARTRLVDEVEADPAARGDVRAWVRCLVRPTAEHLQSLGSPTWWARLSAQLATDPRHRTSVVDEAMASSSLQRTVEGFWSCLSDLPADVRAERSEMSRILGVHVFAEREAALAEGRSTPRSSWSQCADGLTDALVGLWLAPVSR